MALREKLAEDMKAAMRAGERGKLAAIRLIQAAIQAKDLELGQAAFAKAAKAGEAAEGDAGSAKARASDEELLGVLQKMLKQRADSVEAYEKGGRPELAAAERAESEVIAGYLPKAMDEAEMREAIAAAIVETGASGVKDMGKVIAALRAAHAGRMDFSRASGLVKGMLA